MGSFVNTQPPIFSHAVREAIFRSPVNAPPPSFSHTVREAINFRGPVNAPPPSFSHAVEEAIFSNRTHSKIYIKFQMICERLLPQAAGARESSQFI